jgi:hypothetical protein
MRGEKMMRTVKDVEAYLGRMSRHFEAVEAQPGTFVVQSSPNLPPIAVRVDPPLVVLRAHVGDLAAVDHVALLRRLLTLNARALVHASYGLDEHRIVLSCALELENLDYNELEAALEEIEMALSAQVPELSKLAKESWQGASKTP